jgi:hypothetical protein
LRRDSFFAPEVEIFRGVCNWCNANTDKDDLVMKCVRLPLMNVADLLSVVRPAGLVKPDALLDAIAERTNVRLSSLPHRGQLSELKHRSRLPRSNPCGSSRRKRLFSTVGFQGCRRGTTRISTGRRLLHLRHGEGVHEAPNQRAGGSRDHHQTRSALYRQSHSHAAVGPRLEVILADFDRSCLIWSFQVLFLLH